MIVVNKFNDLYVQKLQGSDVIYEAALSSVLPSYTCALKYSLGFQWFKLTSRHWFWPQTSMPSDSHVTYRGQMHIVAEVGRRIVGDQGLGLHSPQVFGDLS